MDDETVKKLRTRHVEWQKCLSASEDLVEQAEMIAITGSWLGRLCLACGRLALRIAQKNEAEARNAARETYDR